ncbi:MAG: hypothetical protein A2W31_05820 [Planctomycetes bacterium RBG_16_64_10]|nr:MAG: hypothetical protein A2W31_05820 [Planctomycetes bacterium RBG_16_64_10]
MVGLAGGGSVLWTVRQIGAATLKKEALGFGDVTLMMMVGAFLGWQPCLIVFFLAPLAGLGVGLVQWIARRDQVIPYGPFLCLAALLTMVFWATIWNMVGPIFAVGWLVPAVMVLCFAAMWVMLSLWRLLLLTVFDRR